jgi:hypothetical protein
LRWWGPTHVLKEEGEQGKEGRQGEMKGKRRGKEGYSRPISVRTQTLIHLDRWTNLITPKPREVDMVLASTPQSLSLNTTHGTMPTLPDLFS